MTNKLISTYYTTRYNVAKNTNLYVTSTGGVGGTGLQFAVVANYACSITNDGRVDAGLNGYHTLSTGIEMEGGGSLVNGSSTYTGALIKGQIGVDFFAAGNVTNFGTIESVLPIYSSSFNYAGIFFQDGGSVTNGSAAGGAALVEGKVGILSESAAGTVSNFGTITGLQGSGVWLLAGGNVTNGTIRDQSASIAGYTGVQDGLGAVINYGTINGDSATGYGIQLAAGGTVRNGVASDPGALIEGGEGVNIAGTAAGTVNNFGTIEGQGGASTAGVTLAAGGLVSNGSGADTTALISGYQGVDIAGTAAGTVNNYGTVKGLGGAYEEGVAISGAARVFNGVAGLIEGGEGVALGGGGVVHNDGTIRGEANFQTGGAGVELSKGGLVYNGAASDRSALITGDYGVFGQGAAGTVDNLGTIASDYQSAGVELTDGGSVANGSIRNAAALITGYEGVKLVGAASLANFGTVSGIGGYGVFLDGAGESVVNGSAGHTRAVITGYQGVQVYSGAVTVNNFGTIGGYGGTALSIYTGGGGSVFLEVEAASAFEGAVLGNAASTLDVASGTGTLSSLSGTAVTVSGSMATTTFSGFGTVEVGAGASFTLTGKATLLAGQTLASAGMLTATGAVASAGVLETLGGTLIVSGAVTGSGSATISGGTMDFTSSFNQAVTFGSTGTLELAQSQTYTANVTGFSKTGATSLDLVDIGFVSSTEATFSGTKTGGVLTVTDGTHTAHISLKGNYLTSTFIASSDGHGGTIVVDPKAKGGAAAPPNPSTHPLIAAMAALGAPGAVTVRQADGPLAHAPLIAGPHVMMA